MGQYGTFSIAKKDNIVIFVFQYCSADHVYFLGLPQKSSLLGNKGKYTPVARQILRILFKYCSTRKDIMEYENVCIMTQVGIYGEIQPDPSGNPLCSNIWISLVLKLQFTVYPSSCHNTDTIYIKAFLTHPQKI